MLVRFEGETTDPPHHQGQRGFLQLGPVKLILSPPGGNETRHGLSEREAPRMFCLDRGPSGAAVKQNFYYVFNGDVCE